MTIGERIRNRRIELNMTQEELAKKAGYKSRSSINKIELSRDLPLKKIEKVAIALDLEPSQLIGWSDFEVSVNDSEEKFLIEVDTRHYNIDHLREYAKLIPTLFELDMIKAYRKLDQIDKIHVLRDLHMDDEAEREKKIHSSQ